MNKKEAEAVKRKLQALEWLMQRHMWTSMTPGPDDKLAEEAKKETEECQEKPE
jgi:hypothetical protein